MATARDVAQYILEKQGDTSAIKIEKLVYYCQAWSLVWVNKQLFADRIEAWANGPVTPELYRAHQGKFTLSSKDNIGDSTTLNHEDKEVVDTVLETYGDKEPFWLVELTHLEEPWKEARKGYTPGQRCNVEITHAAMAEYYSGLV